MNLDRSSSRFFSVDRFEGKVAVLVSDDAASYHVPRSELPSPLSEGDMVLVSIMPAGAPDWRTATIDNAERLRRLANARTTLDRLQKNDPGGDITL